MKIKTIMMCLTVAILLIGISSYGNKVSSKLALQQRLKGGSDFAKIMTDSEYKKRYANEPDGRQTTRHSDGAITTVNHRSYSSLQRLSFKGWACGWAMSTLTDDQQYRMLNSMHFDESLSNTTRFVAVHILRYKHFKIAEGQVTDVATQQMLAKRSALNRGLLREWLFPDDSAEKAYIEGSKQMANKLSRLLKNDYARLSKRYGKTYVVGKPVKIKYVEGHGFIVYQLINTKVIILENTSKKRAKQRDRPNIKGVIVMEDKKEANWYYEKDGKQIGPVTEDEIKSKLEKDNLSYKDMVWQNHVSNRVKLINSELKHLLIDAHSLPINNVFVIIMLLLPLSLIIIHIMEICGWYIPFLNIILPWGMYSEQITVFQILKETLIYLGVGYFGLIVLLVVQFVITYCDLKHMNRKKYDVRRMWWWIWFTPVYLFYRVKSAGRGKVYLKMYYLLIIAFIISFCLRLNIVGYMPKPDADNSNVKKLLVENIKENIRHYGYRGPYPNNVKIELRTIKTVPASYKDSKTLAWAEVVITSPDVSRPIVCTIQYSTGYSFRGQVYISDFIYIVRRPLNQVRQFTKQFEHKQEEVKVAQ